MRLIIGMLGVALTAQFEGCAVQTGIVLRSGGDSVEVRFRNGSRLFGELLAVQDSSFYLLVPSPSKKASTTVARANMSSTSSIAINGYTERAWSPSLLFLQLGAAGMMTIAASSQGNDAGVVLGILTVPILVSAVLLELTEAHPGESAPYDKEKVRELQMYARFPQGASPEVLAQLLHARGQEAVAEVANDIVIVK